MTYIIINLKLFLNTMVGHKKKAFIKSLGDIDERYAIKVKLSGTKRTHTGYCSDCDSDNESCSVVCDTFYFPTPFSVIDCKEELERLISLFNLDSFTSSECNCYRSVTVYNDITYKLVIKKPHMCLRDLTKHCKI